MLTQHRTLIKMTEFSKKNIHQNIIYRLGFRLSLPFLGITFIFHTYLSVNASALSLMDWLSKPVGILYYIGIVRNIIIIYYIPRKFVLPLAQN